MVDNRPVVRMNEDTSNNIFGPAGGGIGGDIRGGGPAVQGPPPPRDSMYGDTTDQFGGGREADTGMTNLLGGGRSGFGGDSRGGSGAGYRLIIYGPYADECAAFANTTGGNNTAFGFEALTANTTGDNNVLLGYQAGDNASTLGGSM